MESSLVGKSLRNSSLYTLDEDFYPECWKDDQKMSIFLSTFRPRSVNPEHYDQKMKFWKEMIIEYCCFKGSPAVSLEELKSVFQRKGTSPYCLSDVFNQMITENNLVEKEVFMQKPKTTLGWAVDSLLVKPLSWGLGKIKEKLVSNEGNEQTVLVVKPAMKHQARIILEHIRNRNNFNNLISMDEIMAEADNIGGLSKEGILIALQFLHTEEKKVYIEENISNEHHRHKILMKFAEPHKVAQPITDIERSIYNLEQTEKFLHETIEQKEQKLNECLEQVKSCLRDGKKQMAKTFLRKKHLLENDLIKTVNILDNIQTMLQRVHASKTEKEIISSYKLGTEALKTTFAASGINIDSTEDIIEDMREVLAEQEECQNIISEPLRNITSDDDELEKELNDLLNKNDDQKPDVPGGVTENKKVEDDVHWMDDELERRLRRLRTELTTLDEPTAPRKPTVAVPRLTN